MNMTSKPGTELREVVPAERSCKTGCGASEGPWAAPGPYLRSGEPKKALPAMRAEQQKRG